MFQDIFINDFKKTFLFLLLTVTPDSFNKKNVKKKTLILFF
jgi:hypothetical protein